MPKGAATAIEGSYRVEVIRKSIHFASMAIPIFYFFTPRNVALLALLPMTALFLSVDILRYYHRPLEQLFNRLFGPLLRRHESDSENKRLNGATYVLIAATIVVFFFPKLVAVTSFVILIISDMAAALVGKRFGRHRFLGKSVEGSLAFFLSGVLVVLALPKIQYAPGEYIIGAAAAAIGAVVEALPIEIDDNLTIPIAVGAVMWGAYLLFFPMFDLYRFG